MALRALLGPLRPLAMGVAEVVARQEHERVLGRLDEREVVFLDERHEQRDRARITQLAERTRRNATTKQIIRLELCGQAHALEHFFVLGEMREEPKHVERERA